MFWRKKKNQGSQDKDKQDDLLLHHKGEPDIEPSIDAEDTDLDEDDKHELAKTEREIIEEANVTPTPRHTAEQDRVEAEELSDHSNEGGWLSRLTKGLSKSSNKLSQGLVDVLTKKKLDDDTLEELEELLISADLGPKTSMKLVEELRKERFGKEVDSEEIKRYLADKITAILEPVTGALAFEHDEHGPFTVLVAGVNGAGKTTTIGKIGNSLLKDGKSVMMAAGDTFRAAAVEQLQVWGERVGAPVLAKDIGADAASVAYEAYEAAKEKDVLLIDTAGRLHNKANLMEELAKIDRVLKKKNEALPHACLLVLDATTGQNAHAQVETFKEMVNVTGLVVTKLDGSAKGGVIVSLADQFGLPIYMIGVGEGADDLQPFRARDFANSLLGIDS